MSESDAGGRKAQMPRDFTGETEHHLNQQIAAMTAHLAFCLERSKDIPLSDDPDGHARGGEVGRAISLAKISAKLATTIGRMKGELSYNFNYNHTSGTHTDLRLLRLADLPETPDGDAERMRRYRLMQEAEDRHRAFLERTSPSPESSRFE